jgi:transcriptional regulator with XRE-family HTH domain
LTQGQLFEQTGITAAYISQIERAQANPTLDMMVKLAQAVGLEAWDMIRPENENLDEK